MTNDKVLRGAVKDREMLLNIKKLKLKYLYMRHNEKDKIAYMIEEDL